MLLDTGSIHFHLTFEFEVADFMDQAGQVLLCVFPSVKNALVRLSVLSKLRSVPEALSPDAVHSY